MHIPQTSAVSQAVQVIRQGRIVAFPTGTSYGLAADCQQGHALQRLRILKNRPADKTFTIFLLSKLWDHFLEFTASERKIIASLEQKPVTVLIRPKKSLAHLAQAGVIGLRMIDHPLMNKLAQAFAGPLTATSANRTGQPPCFDSACIQTTFKNPQADGATYDMSLGCILDAGPLSPCLPSTIIKITNNNLEVIRPGAYISPPA